MNILKLLGFKKKVSDTEPYPYSDILHLWEDDYLMLELLPKENIDFVKSETTRINDFGQEHFKDHGFTEITTIGEKPIKTADKLIDISKITAIITSAGLNKIVQLHMQGVGLLAGENAPLGFGTSKFAIMCEHQKNLLTDIWITGHTTTEDERRKIVDALLLLCRTFNLIAVNWFTSEFYNMEERISVEEFATAF